MPGARSFAAGRSALELDGVVCGFLQSVAGGAITADVVSVPGQSWFDEKHLGGVRYEPLGFQIDLSLDRLVYEWIAASWSESSFAATGRSSRRTTTARQSPSASSSAGW